MAEICFAVTQLAMSSDVDIRWYDIDQLTRHSLAVRRPPGSLGSCSYVSNGRAIEGIDIRIFPNHTNSRTGPSIGVPVGEIGLRGGFVFKGFFNNKEATAAAFYDDCFRSGDVGFVDEGHLFICGRKKEMLIIHGRNYYAHDIEAIVSDVYCRG
jgi:fatty-acyl-CoA synthase